MHCQNERSSHCTIIWPIFIEANGREEKKSSRIPHFRLVFCVVAMVPARRIAESELQHPKVGQISPDQSFMEKIGWSPRIYMSVFFFIRSRSGDRGPYTKMGSSNVIPFSLIKSNDNRHYFIFISLYMVNYPLSLHDNPYPDHPAHSYSHTHINTYRHHSHTQTYSSTIIWIISFQIT